MDVDVASFEVCERVIVRDLLGCMYNTRALGEITSPRGSSAVKYRMDWAFRFEY